MFWIFSTFARLNTQKVGTCTSGSGLLLILSVSLWSSLSHIVLWNCQCDSFVTIVFLSCDYYFQIHFRTSLQPLFLCLIITAGSNPTLRLEFCFFFPPPSVLEDIGAAISVHQSEAPLPEGSPPSIQHHRVNRCQPRDKETQGERGRVALKSV